MRLENKVAIVTGGGTGIGRAIAVGFAKEGAKVVICGRRMEPLEETLNQIKKQGGDGLSVIADVSSTEDIKQLLAKTLGLFEKIDILVNNAGVVSSGDAASTSEQDWDKVMATDLRGVWECSKAVLPEMLKQGTGKIVNIASIAGLVGFAGTAAYCAAKGGVVNLTRQMALDYGPKNININAIAPGVIDTDMTKPFLSDETAKQSFVQGAALGKIGKPEDIAYAAVYLASNESDFVTGHILVVDGGWTIK